MSIEMLNINCKEKTKSQIYIEKLCDEYIVKHIREQERDELIFENNIEKRDIKGYHGREILELLQNADDAYQKSIDEGNKPDCDLEVLIEFKNNVLTFSNTGTFFDENGIKAIVQGNISPKSGNYIGNKGTGFRSILNWADEIKIYSGEFNVIFSKAIAKKKFDEIKLKSQIQKQLKKAPKLYLPILALPQNIDSCLKSDKTSIEVLVNPDKIKDDFGVLKQIENIDLRILLFLPNISRITIAIEEKQITYERFVTEDNFKNITLKKYFDNIIQTQESFYVFEKVIENAIEEEENKKDVRLAIAVPTNLEDFVVGNIYSFFPLLGAESPFNCVMHASYNLGDHRDTIISNETNKSIIIEQLKFLVEVGEKFTSKKYADTALHLLTPVNFISNNWRFSSDFSKFGLEETYLKMLEHVKMLPTLSDSYISVKDYPSLFDFDFPKFFEDKEFSSFLKPIQNEQSIVFIKSLSSRLNQSLVIDKLKLLSIINKLTNTWEIAQKVELFNWWNSNFLEYLPNLLKLQNGEWLNYEEECYFLVGNFSKNNEVPNWVKVPALDDEYQKFLFIYAETLKEIQKAREIDKVTHISRLISQRAIYPLVKFNYRDRSNIISTVNSSVDSYEKSIDFVKWLWTNYREEGEDWKPPKGTEKSPIRYNFPNTKKKGVQNSEKLYFGCAYVNDFPKKLFDKTYEEFPDPNLFSISNDQIKSFLVFISKFGVKKFPVIEKQEVIPSDSYKLEYDSLIKENGDIGSSSYLYRIVFRIPFITNLKDKLKMLSSLEVLKWIHEDISLKSYLSNPFYSENAEIKYLGNLQQNERIYYGQIKNYLLSVFNETEWFDIKGIKYSPKQIIKDINSRNNRRFSDLVPMIDAKMIQNMANSLGIDYNEVIKILNLFEFCDKVTDLSSDDFYGLMLKIPEFDFKKSIDLSKTIYRIIEQANFTKKYVKSKNMNKFFDVGKVLVQYEGKYQYYASKESYLPSTKIISKQNIPIVEKGQRTNNDNFVRMFGCKQYNKEYSIEKDTIIECKSNSSFQNYFSEFLKYAEAYSERNENFDLNIRKLSIKLVEQITIIENNQASNITEEYVGIRESATIWYITVFRNEYEINKISEVIESICSNIANTPGFEAGKLGELFRTREKADREFLIKKDFGSLDVISDESYKNDIKNNFIEVIQKIKKEYPIDKIAVDFDNFTCNENSEKLIKLFLDIGTDINQFKQAGFVYNIDLIPYFKAQLNNFINNEKSKFKNILYNESVNDKALEDIFLNNVKRFENFKIEKYENSIHFNVDDTVRKSFNYWNNGEFCENELVDSDKEYIKNYEILNKNRLFEDEISNDSNVKQMIYFCNSDAFETWCNEQENIEQQLNASKTSNIYSKYKGVIPQKSEVKYRDSGSIKTSHESRPNGVYTKNSSDRINRNKKIFGNKGELLIYNLLCNQFGKENVFPKSEAFVELEILIPGLDSSGQCDIYYRDKTGLYFFVEVKTGDGKSFIMTPGELDFARQNPEQFKLFMVYDIKSDIPQYHELPVRFWKDEKFHKTEIVERIEFKF